MGTYIFTYYHEESSRLSKGKGEYRFEQNKKSSMTNSEIEISQHPVVNISKTDLTSEVQIFVPEMEKIQQAIKPNTCYQKFLGQSLNQILIH